MSSDIERIDYHPQSSLSTDIQVLKSMIFADVKGDTQQERLESFYVTQSDLYDSYRHRMLHGRFKMINAMPIEKGNVWVDIGGGTASNLEYFPKLGEAFSKVVVLDLCKALVETAEKRLQLHEGWSKFVDIILGDACDFNCPGLPPTGSVDIVTFSYALSMIPDWKLAIRNAWRLLKPGGVIAVCDFTVDDRQWKIPPMSALWTWIFSNDHVHLKKEHVEVLFSAFDKIYLERGFGDFPYVPGFFQCPYYVFVGKKNCEHSECPI